jgi:hypothetical protein
LSLNFSRPLTLQGFLTGNVAYWWLKDSTAR